MPCPYGSKKQDTAPSTYKIKLSDFEDVFGKDSSAYALAWIFKEQLGNDEFLFPQFLSPADYILETVIDISDFCSQPVQILADIDFGIIQAALLLAAGANLKDLPVNVDIAKATIKSILSEAIKLGIKKILNATEVPPIPIQPATKDITRGILHAIAYIKYLKWIEFCKCQEKPLPVNPDLPTSLPPIPECPPGYSRKTISFATQFRTSIPNVYRTEIRSGTALYFLSDSSGNRYWNLVGDGRLSLPVPIFGAETFYDEYFGVTRILNQLFTRDGNGNPTPIPIPSEDGYAYISPCTPDPELQPPIKPFESFCQSNPDLCFSCPKIELINIDLDIKDSCGSTITKHYSFKVAEGKLPDWLNGYPELKPECETDFNIEQVNLDIRTECDQQINNDYEVIYKDV